MAKNRKAAEALCVELVESLLPTGHNRVAYEELFAMMSDDQFHQWIEDLKSGENRLCIIAPNQAKVKLTVENNFVVAKHIGHEFFERVWMDSKAGSASYLSNQPYLVVDLPLRRQAQLLVKKISIPENNQSVDNLTGQPTGVSKGSKISYPELNILASHNLTNCITELVKYRGGDIQGFQAMNDSIARTGEVSLKSIEGLGTQVQSTVTLSTYLTSIHLGNSLLV